MKALSLKRNLSLLVLLSLFCGLALAACSGTTLVDVNIDPTTGSGDIVITGDQDGGGTTDNSGAGSAQVGNTDMSQVVLFGVIIALLLGTAAIVISASRRPSGE
jgi:hypothetical protein